jgi:serine carboxypeptidase-like clade 2
MRRGFLSELGPFYPTAGGKLQANPYTWTAAANIIFLESPAFVGFSYSNTSADLVVGDQRTAQDSLQFLLGFFKRFPAYAGRPFWVAGESYGGVWPAPHAPWVMYAPLERSACRFPWSCVLRAGHYVPSLALAISDYDKAGNGPAINLQGFLAGNAWTGEGTSLRSTHGSIHPCVHGPQKVVMPMVFSSPS